MVVFNYFAVETKYTKTINNQSSRNKNNDKIHKDLTWFSNPYVLIVRPIDLLDELASLISLYFLFSGYF